MTSSQCFWKILTSIRIIFVLLSHITQSQTHLLRIQCYSFLTAEPYISTVLRNNSFEWGLLTGERVKIAAIACLQYEHTCGKHNAQQLLMLVDHIQLSIFKKYLNVHFDIHSGVKRSVNHRGWSENYLSFLLFNFKIKWRHLPQITMSLVLSQFMCRISHGLQPTSSDAGEKTITAGKRRSRAGSFLHKRDRAVVFASWDMRNNKQRPNRILP